MTIQVTMMAKISITKRRMSFSMVVIPFFGWPVSFAIWPKTVASPVETTIPRAVPDTQWVPWRPMQRVSR